MRILLFAYIFRKCFSVEEFKSILKKFLQPNQNVLMHSGKSQYFVLCQDGGTHPKVEAGK